MYPDQGRPAGNRSRGVLEHIGGRWAWIVVGVLAVAALTISWVVDSDDSEQVSVATTTSTSPAPSTTVVAPTTTVPAMPSTSVVTPTTELSISNLWTMPDEVGKDLASAKADIVALTDGIVNASVGVEDDTGQGRSQIIHENWKVCSQTPPPGAKFTPESGVSFGVVKNGEACPND